MYLLLSYHTKPNTKERPTAYENNTITRLPSQAVPLKIAESVADGQFTLLKGETHSSYVIHNEKLANIIMDGLLKNGQRIYDVCTLTDMVNKETPNER